LIQGEVQEPFLGVTFTYPQTPDLRRKIPVVPCRRPKPTRENEVRVGVIGAGNYARLMLLPTLKGMQEVQLVGVSTSRGLNAWDAARRFGFEFAASDSAQILDDDRIDLVVIATRHDSHAALAEAALRAGKHVFVEKPLATNEEDLRAVVAAAERSQRHLMVGFNRRFAPLIQRTRQKLDGSPQPLAMLYRINAGAVPPSHWTRDGEEGGGRIVGEVCHFVDLLQYLCASAPISLTADSLSGETGSIPPEDVLTITIRFAGGSIGTIHYFANGDKVVPKEYLEVYGGGRTILLDDFRHARCAEGGRMTHWKSARQDKGQSGELQALVTAIRTGDATPIPLSESVTTTLATFRILDALRCEGEVPVTWKASPPRSGADRDTNLQTQEAGVASDGATL
jgi:predicted dehydrogenase